MISWKAYRTQHLITFMTDLSHWKDIKHNQLRGKAHKVKSRENQGQFSKSPLPVESRMSVTTHVKCCQLQKLVRDLVPRVFIGGWSYRHLLLGIYPSSRLPKGKQVFSINHTVCTNNLGTTNRSNQFWEWWELSGKQSAQMPATGQSCEQSFQRRAGRPAVLTLSPTGSQMHSWSFSSNHAIDLKLWLPSRSKVSQIGR